MTLAVFTPFAQAWIAAAAGWLAVLAASLFYYMQWRRHGRDLKADSVIIPLYAPPKGASPALCFMMNGELAEGTPVNTFLLSSVIHLAARGHLSFHRTSEGTLIRRERGSDADLPVEERMVMRRLFGKALQNSEVAAASVSQQSWRTLGQQMWNAVFFENRHLQRANISRSLWPFLILLAGLLVMLVLLPAGAAQILVPVALGFMSTILFAFVWSAFTSRLALSRWLSIGLAVLLALFSVPAILLFIALPLAGATIGKGPVAEQAALLCGGAGFTGMAVLMFGMYAMISPSPEGHVFKQQLEGFKLFLRVADGGRHAVDAAPELSNALIDEYAAYAVALRLEGGWANAALRILGETGTDGPSVRERAAALLQVR